MAMEEAIVSALVLSSNPFLSCVIGAKIGTSFCSISPQITLALIFEASMSPTKPKSISLTGRLIAGMILPSAPVKPNALQFLACNWLTILLLIQPAYTMVTISSDFSSVIRRPSNIFGSIPSCFINTLAIFPPP